MNFANCREDEYYNEDFLDGTDKVFIKGFDCWKLFPGYWVFCIGFDKGLDKGLLIFFIYYY